MIRLALLLVLASPAAAEEPSCTDKGLLLRTLAEHFHESPIWAGLNDKGNLNVIVANSDTGIWSAISLSPTGCAMVLTTGTWSQLRPQEPPA